MEKAKPVKEGICENCFEQEDIDNGLKVSLFLVEGNLICSMCACQRDADSRQILNEM